MTNRANLAKESEMSSVRSLSRVFVQLICKIYVNTDDNKLSISLLSLLAVISKFCPLRLLNDHLEFPGSLIFPTRGKKGP